MLHSKTNLDEIASTERKPITNWFVIFRNRKKIVQREVLLEILIGKSLDAALQILYL